MDYFDNFILSRPILMKCGHIADCVMRDVAYHEQKVDIAACSYCFKDSLGAIQPACNVSEKQPDRTPLPKIARDYSTMGLVAAGLLCLIGAVALVFITL